VDPLNASHGEFSHVGDGFLDSFLRFWLPFLVLLVGVAFLVWLFNRRSRVVVTDPLRRVAARYASGEIERGEFERIRQDLLSGRRSSQSPEAGDPPPTG
jgi:hypothetical protein